ncbi:IS1/IS1595 family N-terminal zinc-binding domain-containing protein [Leptolyngbya boryana]
MTPICCLDCHSRDIAKHGRTTAGKQRYCCRNAACKQRSSILHLSYQG